MLRRSVTRWCLGGSSKDVCVIGAGIVGCSIALELSRSGYNVHVFEKSTAGAGSGTTSYSSSILRCTYSVFDTVAMAWEAYHYWTNWEDHLRLPSRRRRGGGNCSTTDDPIDEVERYAKFKKYEMLILNSPRSASFLEKQERFFTELDIPFRTLNKTEAVDRVSKVGWDISRNFAPRRISDPQFGDPVAEGAEITGAMLFPEAGYVTDPRLAAQNVALAAMAEGAIFHHGAEVFAIDQEGGHVTGLKVREGPAFFQIDSPIVINAAGSYASKVTAMTFPSPAGDPSAFAVGHSSSGNGGDRPANDMKMVTRPLRAEVAFLQSPPEFDVEQNGFIAADVDLGIYLRPETGNRWLVGSLDPDCDPHCWIKVDELDEMSPYIGDQWEHNVYRAALRNPSLPLPTAMDSQGIASTCDATEDFQPVLDKSSLGGYYMAIGTSGNCFKMSPVVGKAMAAIVDHEENKHSPSSWRGHDQEPLQLPLTMIASKRGSDGNRGAGGVKGETPRTINLGAFSRLRSVHDSAGVMA